MRKIAIRLGILAFTMVLGVLVFIWYRSTQPPALLGLVPQDIRAGGFIDTRNVVKKAFKYGTNELTDLPYPELFMGVFALAQNPKEVGINVYSELVWFEHKDGFRCLFARLSNPEKWEEFLKKYQAQAGLSDIEETDDIRYVFLQNYNAILAWRGKHLALLYDYSHRENLSFSQVKQVLKPDAYNQSLSEAYRKITPDVFYMSFEDDEQYMTFALKILQGKVRYEMNLFNAPVTEFESFHAVKAPEGKLSDTSLVMMNAAFLRDFKELDVLSSLNFAGNSIGAGLYYYKPNDSAKANVRVQPFLNGLEFPAEYGIENPSEIQIFADATEKMFSEMPVVSEIITDLPLPSCKRFLMLMEKNSKRKRMAGTCYFADTRQLPLKEVTLYLLENTFLNLAL